jgi:hypothetical protein
MEYYGSALILVGIGALNFLFVKLGRNDQNGYLIVWSVAALMIVAGVALVYLEGTPSSSTLAFRFSTLCLESITGGEKSGEKHQSLLGAFGTDLGPFGDGWVRDEAGRA